MPQVGDFKFDQVEIVRAYPFLQPHILLYSNGLAIRNCFPDITNIKK